MRGANIKGKSLTKKLIYAVFFILSPSITNILPNNSFQHSLKKWYIRHKRDLPWRSTSDPYRIWLSEIILQQTRVQQGLPYYHRFVEHYPTVQELCNAEEGKILKDWEGLGYYSRARNMHAAAKQIVEQHRGEFPRQYEDIRALKGIGDYTAAAIASFAFKQPHATLDGNVFRVLSRYLGINTPINTTEGKNEFTAAASKMLDHNEPDLYNQAIMEFGALQCVPKNPDCGKCPLSENCFAFNNRKVNELPAKVKKKYDRHRYFTFLEIHNNNLVLLEKRIGKDVWRNLFQFPLEEGTGLFSVEEMLGDIYKITGHQRLDIHAVTDLPPHKLSHQTLHIRIITINCEKEIKTGIGENQYWVEMLKLEQFALPRPLRKYMDRKQLTLRLGTTH